MRRPVLYLAGLLLASGASLALAGPAQAAVSHGSQATNQSASSHDWCDEDDDDYYFHHHRRHHHRHGGDFYGGDYYSYTSNNGILNGNSIGIDIL
ncbi:hypothetical protein JIG36_30915 [Actinoplanes sp. LDG1-06]|uniref:Secreted protein n=1 Tax=Paractinoplanes ovalisporus TaxID=2810368 RepID=A0ABS2AJ90_9ACTN|nr:hypothetical protein [Actinoplanes ovalisporus]MBM2619933.1 hypothetical protein [Actinoplanes ovalisporus]